MGKQERTEADGPLATLLPYPESDPVSLFRPDERLVPFYGKGSGCYEQYQKVRVELLNAARERGISPKLLVVTSSVPGEGKTLTAVNLALALQQSGNHRVLLIEADMRKPRVAEMLRRVPRHGLAQVLNEEVELEKALEDFRGSGLRILVAGRTVEDPLKLLETTRLSEVLAQARERYDHILLDTPPSLPFPDASILAAKSDGMVFVVRTGTTPREKVMKALEGLDRTRLLGMIANDLQHDETRGYYRYYQNK